MCMSAYFVVSCTTQVHELLKSGGWPVTIVDDIGHVTSQDKRNSVPTYGRIELLVYETYSGISNKGHLCIKDTFRCTNLYSGNTFLPLKEDNFSIMDKMLCPRLIEQCTSRNNHLLMLPNI